jgi:hypothetical protein
MDVFLPVSERIEELLEESRFDVTQSFASEMVLAESSTSREGNSAVRIERVSQDEIDTFSTVLMKSMRCLRPVSRGPSILHGPSPGRSTTKG